VPVEVELMQLQRLLPVVVVVSLGLMLTVVLQPLLQAEPETQASPEAREMAQPGERRAVLERPAASVVEQGREAMPQPQPIVLEGAGRLGLLGSTGLPHLQFFVLAAANFTE